MKLKELAQCLDVDLPSVLSRFAGNEALYLKFLKKFPADPTFSLLEAAIAQNEWAEAERNAHTLKGVAAHLGLTILSRRCDALVQAIRQGKAEEFPLLHKQCRQEYNLILERLRQLE